MGTKNEKKIPIKKNIQSKITYVHNFLKYSLLDFLLVC